MSDLFVYFVTCEEFLKIGISKDPKERLRTMKTGNPFPLELLGYTKGNKEMERTLHIKFKEYAHRGEWFVATEELTDYVKQLCLEGEAERAKALHSAVALLDF